MSQALMGERGDSGRSSSSSSSSSSTSVFSQDPLPDLTQTLIQKLPGYFTPQSSEFSFSVSTDRTDSRRELQSPDDGRPSTSPKRRHRDRTDSRRELQSPDDGRPSTSSKRCHRDSSPGIMSTSSSSRSVGNVKRWLCGLKSFSSKGSYIVQRKRSGDRSESQYEQGSGGNRRLSRTNSFEEFMCPPLPGQVPIDPTETSNVRMEPPPPVNKSSTEKPKKRKRSGSLLRRMWKAVKYPFLCCFAVDDVEPFVPPADLDSDPDPSSPDPDHSAVKPNNGSFETLYNVGEMIGSGGFGRVFEGTRKLDGKKVAIKRMRKTYNDLYLAIPGHPKPLITEVALLLKMRQEPISPYVIQLYDWFEHPRKFTLIMEFPEPCESLLDFISRNPQLHETTARIIMRQAVLAVQHCIERGVFHSDVHAQNFLLRKNMLQLKLIDFGSGHLLSADGYESDIYVGVLDYCPPEVHTEPRFHAVPTNVWALGVMLYEMVNPCRPFLNTLEITEAKVTFLNSNLSKECSDLISQCLTLDPTKRPTLEQMLQHEWIRNDQEKIRRCSGDSLDQ